MKILSEETKRELRVIILNLKKNAAFALYRQYGMIFNFSCPFTFSFPRIGKFKNSTLTTNKK